MSITVVADDRNTWTAPLEREPVYPFYARVKRDYEITSDGRPRTQGRYAGITIPSVDFAGMKDAMPGVKVGMPDQYAYQPNGFIPLTAPLQWLLMDINCLACYGLKFKDLNSPQRTEARLSWRNLVMDSTCFTNGTSWKNGFTDYVQPMNLAAKNPLQWEQILCPGYDTHHENFVKVLGKPVMMTVGYFSTSAKPYAHVPIECVDLTKPLPTPEAVWTTPWLCHRPSISTGQPLLGGVYGHEPFPMFGEQSRYFLMAKGGIGYYRADWLERL